MKKFMSAALLTAALPFSLLAQEKKEKANDIKKPSSDFVMIQLHHDGWQNNSNQTINTTGIGRGFSAYLMYDFKIGQKENSHFSFAAGLGFSANNIYLKKQLPNLKTTESVLPFITTDSTIKGNKYTTGYLEMPLELRYFSNSSNRNKGFKIAIGAKVGLLMNSHAKYSEGIGGTYVVQKMSAKKFNQTWKLAPYARIGWGNFSVFAQYNVTSLYQLNKGPEITPYSIGLTITGL